MPKDGTLANKKGQDGEAAKSALVAVPSRDHGRSASITSTSSVSSTSSSGSGGTAAVAMVTTALTR